MSVPGRVPPQHLLLKRHPRKRTRLPNRQIASTSRFLQVRCQLEQRSPVRDPRLALSEMFGGGVRAAVLLDEAFDGFGFLDHIEPATVDVLGNTRCEQGGAVLGQLVLDHNANAYHAPDH